jgi:hypothetical protein
MKRRDFLKTTAFGAAAAAIPGRAMLARAVLAARATSRSSSSGPAGQYSLSIPQRAKPLPV